MRKIITFVTIMLLTVNVSVFAEAGKGCEQINLPQVEKMPNIPQPFQMRDWKLVARDFDDLVFDFEAEGEHFPLVWIDKSNVNKQGDTFGIPTTVGDPRTGPDVYDGSAHGAIDCISAVLSATYVGIDKSDQHGYNFVDMCKGYYHPKSGRDMLLYWTHDDIAQLGAGMQKDFWLDVMPNEMLSRLVYSYPDEKKVTKIMKRAAERWYEASRILDGNYKWSYFDFKDNKPKMSIVKEQPDAAAAIAMILYRGYKKFGDEKYLTEAERALTWLNGETKNWLYDTSMYNAPYLAARLNAEQGRDYDVEKMLNWVCSDDSDKWRGRRIIAERWGDVDAHGLSAAGHSRAYAMETFYTVAFIVPMLRYDQRYARAIGKWMLNMANASRLFYGSEIPDDYQSYPDYRGDVKRCIGYEAVHGGRRGKPYYASRDNWKVVLNSETFFNITPVPAGAKSTVVDFPRAAEFTLYGSSFAGFLGGIIERTEQPAILKLDVMKLDVFPEEAYPTYLYFNPYQDNRNVSIDVGEKAVDLYDTVTGKFIRKNVKGKTVFQIKPDSAVVVVLVPTDGKVVGKKGRIYVNDVVIDYRREKVVEEKDEMAMPGWAIGPFAKYEGNPVLAPSKSGWDEGHFGGGVHNGSIIVKDAMFYYIYRGEKKISTSPGYFCKIGLATSRDGYKFRKSNSNPLFGKDDKYSYEDVEIVSYKGTYYLYVNRWDWNNVSDTTECGTWLATSKDLRNWKEHGIVFPGTKLMHRNGTVLQNPENEAVKVNGKFIMYLNSGIVAYSDDLINWKSKKAVKDWPGGECCKAITNYRDKDSDDIVLITGGGHCGHGVDMGVEWGQDYFYAIGEVLLSKKNPEKPIEVLKRPVLFAEEKYLWESGKSVDDPTRAVSKYNDCIFLNGITRYKGKWWVYYGGSEYYTCLATSPAVD